MEGPAGDEEGVVGTACLKLEDVVDFGRAEGVAEEEGEDRIEA